METRNIEKKDGKVSFQVAVDAETFEKEVNKAYLKNKKSIFVPGFRKGKAPRAVVEGMYGKDVFHEEAVDALALGAYQEGVKATEAKTVGDPAITDYKVEEDKSLVISFEAALYPEATLGEYKGLTAYKAPVEVTDAEVDSELASVQRRNARIVSVDRAAKLEDTVNIDFDGYRDGKRFSGGKGENYDLKLGSGSFVPGFEDQLVGVKAGEQVEVKVTFPENYAKELAGADAVFKVKVHEVKETLLPELDDEFAQDVSEFDTLQEYKDSLRKELESKKQERADSDFHEVLLRKASDNLTVEIPDAMINRRVSDEMEELARRCQAQGYTLQSYLQSMGMNESMYRSIMRPNITTQIRVELTMEKIAEAENLTVSPEEIAAEYKAMAERFEMPEDKVKELVTDEMVERDLKLQKARDLVYETAVASDKPETAEKDAAEAEEHLAPAAAPAAGEAPAAEATPAAEEAPAEPAKKPARKRTTRKKAAPAEEKPAEEKPAEEKPAEE